MRSMKLLVATALVAALVAGPVLAQDAMSGSAPAATASTTAPAKTTKHTTHKKGGKKHHKSASSTTTAPATGAAQ